MPSLVFSARVSVAAMRISSSPMGSVSRETSQDRRFLASAMRSSFTRRVMPSTSRHRAPPARAVYARYISTAHLSQRCILEASERAAMVVIATVANTPKTMRRPWPRCGSGRRRHTFSPNVVR